MIPKHAKDPELLQSYRGMNLLSFLAKIFESCDLAEDRPTVCPPW